MAKCRKCGERLGVAAKFCVTCGAPVPDIPATLESAAFTSPLPVRQPEPVTEPPKTKASMPAPEPSAPAVRSGSNYGPPPPAPNPAAAYPQPPAQQPAVQQSWGGQPPYGTPAQPYPANPAYPYAPAPAPGYPGAPPAGYGPYAPPPYAPPPFNVGGRVLVLWADGNRYPGMVHQVAQGQCLVVFPDGQQRWVEFQYLMPVR